MTRRRSLSPKPQSRPREDDLESASAQRLQKVLAAAGVASRRDCEELIREGRVEVDRQVVTELGTKVDPVGQEIRVDGEAIRRPKRVYFALNKPEGVVCTNHDPSGRPRVIDLVPSDERVFAVGRLDLASEGLIVVTNDGNFANHITHPRFGVEKTYLVRVAGRPGPEELAKLRRGIHLAEGFCKVESVVVKSRHKQSSDLLIVLDEGRNREIRRILAKVGHKVVRLKRIAVGDLKLGDLVPGEWRKLSAAEVEALMAISRQKRKEKRKPPPREAAEEEVVDRAKVSREARMKKAKPKTAIGSESAEPSPALPKIKPPSAKSIAAKLLAGKDFEDDDDDDEDLSEDLADEGWDDDADDDVGDDDDDLISQTVIREEIKDDDGPPRSGPAPRGNVIEFDEDSPPPLQPKKVREARSDRRNEQPAAPPRKRNERSAPRGERPAPRGDRAASEDRPLRAEPRTGHRRRGDATRPGQDVRRGQRHRQAEGSGAPTGRPGTPGKGLARPDREEARGRNPRREKPAANAPRGEERTAKAPLPKRPGKLVTDRPQEARGARGKFPGKSFGKGKKFEGGGRGAKTIFGKRVKKKNRGQS